MHAFDRPVFIALPQPLKLFLHSNRFIITAFKLDYNMLICAYCVFVVFCLSLFSLLFLSSSLWAPLSTFFFPFPIFLSRPVTIRTLNATHTPKAWIYFNSINVNFNWLMDKHRRFSGSTASRVTKYQQQQPLKKTAHTQATFWWPLLKTHGCSLSMVDWYWKCNRIYLEMWFEPYS